MVVGEEGRLVMSGYVRASEHQHGWENRQKKIVPMVLPWTRFGMLEETQVD